MLSGGVHVRPNTLTLLPLLPGIDFDVFRPTPEAPLRPFFFVFEGGVDCLLFRVPREASDGPPPLPKRRRRVVPKPRPLGSVAGVPLLVLFSPFPVFLLLDVCLTLSDLNNPAYHDATVPANPLGFWFFLAGGFFVAV